MAAPLRPPHFPLVVLLARVLLRGLVGAVELDSTDPLKRYRLACFIKQQLDLGDRQAQCCLPPETWNRTCAFVGNSGVLLSGRYDRDIDTHPFALRLNDAPVRGYEQYVGSKLSLRGGWNTHPKHRPGEAANNSETYVYCNDSGQIAKHEKMLRQFPGIRLNPMVCDEKRLEGLFKTLYPNRLGAVGPLMKLSSGGQVMFAALQSCSEVHVYGMFPTRMDTAHHYFGKFSNGPLTDTGHSFWEAEHDLWARLSVTPLAKINKRGKAVIRGLRGLKGCSPAHANHTGFMTPYYVLPIHRDSWQGDIATFDNRRREYDAKQAEKKRKKEAKEREKKRKKKEAKNKKKKKQGADSQRGVEPQPQPQLQTLAESTTPEAPRGSGGGEERPAMVAAQVASASSSAAEATAPVRAPPALVSLSVASSLPFLLNATIPGLQRPLQSSAEWAVAVVGASFCCLFALALCRRNLSRRIGMVVLAAATLVGLGLLSTAFVDSSVTWARWSMAK